MTAYHHEMLASKHYELTRSKHQEFGVAQPGPYILDFELMQTTKAWQGTLPYWRNQDTASIMKSVTDRQNFRKRYNGALWTFEAGADLGGGTASETWGLTGAGLLPHGTAVNEPLFVGDPSEFNYVHNHVWNNSGGLTSVSETGYIAAPGPRPDTDTQSVSLSGSVVFADTLKIATDRVQARTWPTKYNGGGTAMFESYGEHSAQFNGDTYLDGAWHSIPGAILGFTPYLGDTLAGTDNFLWTGWIWAIQTEETIAVVDPIPYFTPIMAQRCRFRTNRAKPFFICRATINRMTGVGPTVGGTDYTNTADALWNVRLISAGTTIADHIYELGWPAGDPGETDFVSSELFLFGGPTLSIGSCTFAIVGETPTAWQARTGFVLNT